MQSLSMKDGIAGTGLVKRTLQRVNVWLPQCYLDPTSSTVMKKIVSPSDTTEVGIIGAGPYGLSIAAHLTSRDVPFRIFGRPMSAWSEHMPKGMKLKSDGFASSLSDPCGEFTLRHYCRQEKLPYSDTGVPVPLETFIDYGLAFQARYASRLESRIVVSVEERPTGFELGLEGGEKLLARRVIVAVGITYYAHVPPILAGLPNKIVTHSSAHKDFSGFAGREVAVIGAGASALDAAALLLDVGAKVQLIARAFSIRFHDPPRPRSRREKLLRPTTGIGSGMQLFFYANMPGLFRLLPEDVRLDRVRKTLGPAPGWFVRDKVQGRMPLHLGAEIVSATVHNKRASLVIRKVDGQQKTIEVDHVIAATGYRTDLNRLAFLSPAIRDRIRRSERAPVLSSCFESTVPGLYFVGATAANSFGPVMRFAFGADFTARRVSRHLAKVSRHPTI